MTANSPLINSRQGAEANTFDHCPLPHAEGYFERFATVAPIVSIGGIAVALAETLRANPKLTLKRVKFAGPAQSGVPEK